MKNYENNTNFVGKASLFVAIARKSMFHFQKNLIISGTSLMDLTSKTLSDSGISAISCVQTIS